MMRQQAYINSRYNELVIDAEPYTAQLPSSIAAFFFPEESSEAVRDDLAASHAAFLAEYQRSPADTPLLQFAHTQHAGRPFTCVVCS